MRLSSLSPFLLAAVGVLGRHEKPRHSHIDDKLGISCGNLGKIHGGMKTVAYFGNWDIYAVNYFITDVPAESLTHLVYAFANVNSTTGSVILSDTWADLQYAYPGDNTTAPGENVYGNIKQMFLLKKKHRHLKTMLSIGGWSYRENFAPMLASPTKRQNFVNTAVQFVADLGFDGIDIDYEYVADHNQAAQMVDLLRRLRQSLDQLAEKINATSPFQISYASPSSNDQTALLDLTRMTPYLDFYTLMALDYMGPGFSNYSGYLSNLFPDVHNPRATDYDTTSSLEFYLFNGQVPPNKIVLENPLYGRVFNGTDGMGDKFANGGTQGSLGTAGLWNYKALPLPGFNAKVVNVPRVGGSYSYDAEQKYLISYDTPEIAALKAEYVQCLGLAGTAWWEVSMDRNDTLSLISTTVSKFGGAGSLDQTLNNLNYPTSTYANLKDGFSDN
ncbi:Endochitinase B1 [Penicillium canariense]|uniref:chitinase n=1 Tax=Penicillium canariense TaxID=189055 RepID=A0A9W9LIZ9_9EURO|nr:Endochitinase B1 [Penicillium canariense]KAJ5160307.1 Endochitinase B1 [Penicillium canariense]